MNKELEELIHLAKNFPETDKAELRQFTHLEVLCDKKLEALEIIKKKRVNLEYIKCCETYEQYKTICSYWNEITKEEYELLKEVLL